MKSRHDEIRRKYGKGLGVPVPAGRVPPGVSVIVTLQEAVGRAAGSPGTEVPLLHKVVLSRADITDPTQCPEGRGWAVGLSQTSLGAPRAHEAQRHDPRGPPRPGARCPLPASDGHGCAFPQGQPHRGPAASRPGLAPRVGVCVWRTGAGLAAPRCSRTSSLHPWSAVAPPRCRG